MTPEADQILNLSAMQILGSLAPLLPPGYAQGTASLVAFMMMLSAQEYGRAAEIRAAENTAMRALFAELAPTLSDAALAAKLKAASAQEDKSLAIAALDAANADLRRLLIALHAAVESEPEANAKVWRVLTAMADGRLLKLPGS